MSCVLFKAIFSVTARKKALVALSLRYIPASEDQKRNYYAICRTISGDESLVAVVEGKHFMIMQDTPYDKKKNAVNLPLYW